jgi:hypothetical protein
VLLGCDACREEGALLAFEMWHELRADPEERLLQVVKLGMVVAVDAHDG